MASGSGSNKRSASGQPGPSRKKPKIVFGGKTHFQSDLDRHEKIRDFLTKKLNDKSKDSLKELDDKLSKGGDRKEIFRVWCEEHAERLYPGIGQTAHAVPLFLLPKKCKLESDCRGVDAQRKVGQAFRLLNNELERRSEKTMFIITNYLYEHMLIWLNNPGRDIEGQFRYIFQKRDFFKTPEECGVIRHEPDLMILHEQKGVIFVQVKSVGTFNAKDKKKNKAKVEKGIEQLEHDERVFKHVMQHLLKPDSRFTKILALPNFHSRQKVLDLGITEDDLRNRSIRLLLKPELFEDDITKAERDLDLQKFMAFWGMLADNEIPLSFIKDTVARYVGDLSRPRQLNDTTEQSHVRDAAMAICKTGHWFRRLVLSQQQEDILGEDAPEVFLKGPGGSSQTMLLACRAYDFAEDNGHVFVIDVSSQPNGTPHGRHICQILRAHSNIASRIYHVPLKDTSSYQTEVQKYVQTSPNPENVMFVIPDFGRIARFQDIATALSTPRAQNVKVWCAEDVVLSQSYVPTRFLSKDLKHVLRCPPTVRNVMVCASDRNDSFRSCYIPDAINKQNIVTNGPMAISIRHVEHATSGAARIWECQDCAENLVELLGERKLNLTGSRIMTTRGSIPLPCSIAILANLPEEVNRLAASTSKTAEDVEDRLKKLKDCPFLKTLIGKIPPNVNVVTNLNEEFEEKHDEVTVAWHDSFKGLERDVIIFLPCDGSRPSSSTRQATAQAQRAGGVRHGIADMYWKKDDLARYSDWDKKSLLSVASACSAQLILLVP